jgi:hypothetical protein
MKKTILRAKAGNFVTGNKPRSCRSHAEKVAGKRLVRALGRDMARAGGWVK